MFKLIFQCFANVTINCLIQYKVIIANTAGPKLTLLRNCSTLFCRFVPSLNSKMSDRTAMNGDNDCQGKVMEKKEKTI